MTSKMIFAVALLTASLHALQNNDAWSQNPAASNPEPASKGWVLGMDEEMFPPAGAPGQHFHRARAEILNGSFESAQQEIRKGTSYLLKELNRSTEKGKQLLQTSIAELEHLTETLGKAETNYYELQASGIEQVFGKSSLALAQEHELRAAEAWRRRKPEDTGRQLNAAILHLRHAWAWLEAGTGRVMKTEGRAGLVLTREQLIEADAAAQALVKGSRWTDERVQSGLTNIGKEIDALRQAVAGPQTPGER